MAGLREDIHCWTVQRRLENKLIPFFGTYASRKDVLRRRLGDVCEKFNHKRLIASFSGRHFRTFGELHFETRRSWFLDVPSGRLRDDVRTSLALWEWKINKRLAKWFKPFNGLNLLYPGSSQPLLNDMKSISIQGVFVLLHTSWDCHFTGSASIHKNFSGYYFSKLCIAKNLYWLS